MLDWFKSGATEREWIHFFNAWKKCILEEGIIEYYGVNVLSKTYAEIQCCYSCIMKKCVWEVIKDKTLMDRSMSLPQRRISTNRSVFSNQKISLALVSHPFLFCLLSVTTSFSPIFSPCFSLVHGEPFSHWRRRQEGAIIMHFCLVSFPL